MKRRSKIKTAAFSIALFAAMLTWGISASAEAKAYKTQVEINSQRALIQLCEYLDNIEVSLTKSLYAGSDNMMSVLTTQLHKQATGAKTSLSALSSGDTQLVNTYKFLSQVGEYTASLNKKAANGQQISAKDRETLSKLLEFASKLSNQFDFMAQLLDSSYLSFEELDQNIMQAEKGSESMVTYMTGVSDAEEAMTDFPSLIYDGPFSDNILSKDSQLLGSSKPVSIEQAKKTAARLMGAEEKFLVEDEPSEGQLSCYNFHTDTMSAAITKNGGYPLYLLSESAGGEARLSGADAVEKAAEILYKAGYLDMKSSYYACEDGVCTVNFAYVQEGFVCYPDLIKVGVSLYDGSIVSLDAADYIMNHKKRDIPDAAVSEEAAGKEIAPSLTLKSSSCAVIPTDGGGENFAYELLCESEDGRHVLVYKDIVSGKEDDILILLYSDNGTLTK